MKQIYLSSAGIRQAIKNLIPHRSLIFGVPRGGAIVAEIAEAMGHATTASEAEAEIIIDDIEDSGRTRKEYEAKWPNKTFLPIFSKIRDEDLQGRWVVFPWEEAEDKDAEHNIVRLLQHLGEDPNRDGLKDTPKRVIKAWRELCSGYGMDPAKILARTFEEPNDEMVICRNIDFHSTCEHHMLPFTGVAHIGYLPKDGKVVGLSKMARLVDCFARRLQVQEKLTREIADAMYKHLDPLGVGVVIVAKHSCMSCRGVGKQNAEMVTSSLLDAFRDGPVRAEFLSLIRK